MSTQNGNGKDDCKKHKIVCLDSLEVFRGTFRPIITIINLCELYLMP